MIVLCVSRQMTTAAELQPERNLQSVQNIRISVFLAAHPLAVAMHGVGLADGSLKALEAEVESATQDGSRRLQDGQKEEALGLFQVRVRSC